MHLSSNLVVWHIQYWWKIHQCPSERIPAVLIIVFACYKLTYIYFWLLCKCFCTTTLYFICTSKCLNVYASSSSSLGMRSRSSMLSLRWLFSELYSFCNFSSSRSSALSRCRCTACRFLTCFIRNGFKSKKAMLVNFLWWVKGTGNSVKTIRTVGKTNYYFLKCVFILIIVILDD